MSGPSFFVEPPCDQPAPANEPLRSPCTVPVDSGAMAASSEGRAAGGGGFGPSTGFAAVGLFDRRRRFFFDSFLRRFFSFLRRFRSLRSRLASLSSLELEEEESRRRRPIGRSLIMQYVAAMIARSLRPPKYAVLRSNACSQPALGGTLHAAYESCHQSDSS